LYVAHDAAAFSVGAGLYKNAAAVVNINNPGRSSDTNAKIDVTSWTWCFD
jgi:hypothetical protein